jgi:thimet oligopeptidase
MESSRAPAVVYREQSLVGKLLRDLLTADFQAIRIDHAQEYQRTLDLVQRMNRASAFGRASSISRQNMYSAISYVMYKGDPAGIDPDAVTDNAVRKYAMVEALPGTHEYASFGHLGSYSSAYYTYMWDKVIALDFFSQFDAADPFKGDTALRYRRTVLEPGALLPA